MNKVADAFWRWVERSDEEERLMIYENDHTDAEFARREHAAEMGEESPSEKRWMQFCRDCERLLGVDSLDGEESEDGFSLDTAHDAFEAGKSPAEYVEGRVPRVRARLSGFTKKLFGYSAGGDLDLLVKEDTDLDSAFKAFDLDGDEFISVNGWLFTFEEPEE